ncbi:MAG: pur operon repressor [Caldicoprobacterales bacterium]|jgi:purine operon repressor|nr:pur operon repressor [Clostridiales bacterium]
MGKIRRNERIGAMVKILSSHPNKIFTLNNFSELFQTAKSTISDDLVIIKEIFDKFKLGHIETVVGAAGGVRYIPGLFEEDTNFIEDICNQLSEVDRILPGGFLYMTDILFTPEVVERFGKILATQFQHTNPDFVITVETKGIPIALMTARALNCPVVVARRESKVTEGSTVSINYVSASSRRIQTMSLVKRSVQKGQRGLIVDDFMKGGGTARGLRELLHEFEAEIAGVGVIISTADPEEKLVKDYKSLMVLKKVDEIQREVIVEPSSWIRK